MNSPLVHSPPSSPSPFLMNCDECMATPKTANMKRKHVSVVLPNENSNSNNASGNGSSASSTSSTQSMSNSTSNHSSSGHTHSLDCQSLQRSLKRVRLSSSPGELRLQLDLRHLVLSDNWRQVGDERWEWPGMGCTLEQSRIDPLRLVLLIPSNQARNEPSRTAVWIQIPRHYPHRPPAVTRIQYNVTSTTSCFQYSSTVSIPSQFEHVVAHASLHSPSTAAAAGGSGAVLPKIQAVWITTDPEQDGGAATPAALRPYTAVYSGWTAIGRLSDILQFLNNTLSQQHNNIVGNGASASETMTLPGRDTQQHPHPQIQYAMLHPASTAPSSLLMAEADRATERRHDNNGDNNDHDDLGMTDAEYGTDLHRSFPPNRFDVGYERTCPEPFFMDVSK